MRLNDLPEVILLTNRLAPIQRALAEVAEKPICPTLGLGVTLSSGTLQAIEDLVIGDLARQEAQLIQQLTALGVDHPLVEAEGSLN